LTGRELWLATDNMTCETTFYRGSSTSRYLHELMFDLRLLTVRGHFILHVVRIAGTRMIEIGVEGLSCGETRLGALNFSFGDALPMPPSMVSHLLQGNSWGNFIGVSSQRRRR
jgi:hypothetical protein